MPDILIRMEMPEIKNNHGIKAELRRIDGRLELGFMTGGYSCCEQWTYYPIHELPPHGDLIDRDAIVAHYRECERNLGSDRHLEFLTVHDWIEEGIVYDLLNAPAVVPAERSEP